MFDKYKSLQTSYTSVETKVRFYYLVGAGGLVAKSAGPLAKFGGLAGCQIVNRMPDIEPDDKAFGEKHALFGGTPRKNHNHKK